MWAKAKRMRLLRHGSIINIIIELMIEQRTEINESKHNDILKKMPNNKTLIGSSVNQEEKGMLLGIGDGRGGKGRQDLVRKRERNMS